MPPARVRLAKSQYELLAALRLALARFLHFSREEARRAGLAPQQHQALLVIKGFPDRDSVGMGELAQRLHLKHHSVVGLVDRLAARGFLRRTRSARDRRRVEVSLTPRGEAVIARLSAAHLRELRQLGPELHRLIGTILASSPLAQRPGRVPRPVT